MNDGTEKDLKEFTNEELMSAILVVKPHLDALMNEFMRRNQAPREEKAKDE